MTVQLVVTRVQPQATHWVELFAQHGYQAFALPLIEVFALADPSAIPAAWRRWGEYAAVMFVSAQAVDFFYAHKPVELAFAQLLSTTQTRVWAPGLATRAALLGHGVAAEQVDCPGAAGGQFDSEALWQQVHNQARAGSRVLIVRGELALAAAAPAPSNQGVGRDWLAQRLQANAVVVEYCVAYQRAAPLWTSAQHQAVHRVAQQGALWLFSSSEAVHYLRQLMPQQSWQANRAIATHARIAQAARKLGFACVLESAPGFAAVLESVESLL